MGGLGLLRSVEGSVTATTGVTLGSTYRMCRVPSNAKIKHIYVGLDATVTTFTVDIGATTAPARSTAPARPTSPRRLPSIRRRFLRLGRGLGLDRHPDRLRQRERHHTAAKRQQPLWQALGLTVDPGGFIDIVLTNTATNSGAPVVHCEVQYVE
jgi:hypothetical protein